MGNTEFALLIITLAFAFLYSLLIILLSRGWMRLKRFRMKEDCSTFISVIIPVRNEADSLERLPGLLEAQQYPGTLHEFILVNDHSTDESPEILASLPEKKGLRVLHLPDGVAGKKAAIRYGMEHASGSLITTLDADGIPGPYWLASIATVYEKENYKMIAGPVAIREPKGWLASFQALELLSLVASGAGAIGIGRPIMCNGANLSYEKNAFMELGGFEGNENIPGGDDIFLLEKINRHYPGGSTGFNTNPEGIVFTSPSPGLKSFLNQRLRWVSKSPSYKDPFLITSAIIVLGFNLLLLFSLIRAFISLPGLLVFTGLFLLKCLVDLPILWKATKFFDQRRLMAWYLPFQFIYFIFISLSGVLGNLLSFRWKDRPYG
jgi:cellulose synthase/poly-beta-1,6-N-acetylglucosamine synthase-like glycosyltransferase